MMLWYFMRGYTPPPDITSLTCVAASLTCSGGNSAAVLFGFGPRACALQGALMRSVWVDSSGTWWHGSKPWLTIRSRNPMESNGIQVWLWGVLHTRHGSSMIKSSPTVSMCVVSLIFATSCYIDIQCTVFGLLLVLSQRANHQEGRYLHAAWCTSSANPQKRCRISQEKRPTIIILIHINYLCWSQNSQNDLLWYYNIHSYPTNPDSWLPWSILIMLGRPYQCHGSYGPMWCPVQVALRVLCRMADVLDGHSVSRQLERDGRGKLWKTSRCVVSF